MADPKIIALINAKAKQYGVPVSLAHAVVAQESGYNPNAHSPVGAGGLMQLMPGTAKGLGVTNVFDPVQNVDGGMRMLGNLIHQLKSIPLALAAYNAGPGAVAKYGGIPPYKETQNYVKSIMSKAGALSAPGAAWGGGPEDQGTRLPPGSPAPTGLAGMQGPSVAALTAQAAPSDASVDILNKLGGMAGRAAQASQALIPFPGQPRPQPQGKQQQDPYNPVPVIPHGPGLDGSIPMHTGGKNPYTNLHFAGHVDFQHVNPRLLDALNKEGKKLGGVVTVISGYRSNDYSARVGGFAGDPHSKGLAVDAYVNGHPIGEVVGPEVWAKYGIRSGNTPGFYKGKPDPEHLDLMGVPVKQTKSPKA